jgi:cysteine-rich repeat protein
VCGNAVIEMHEDCEADDLAGATCESLGYSGTGLTCTDDCLFDASTCSICGDGVIEGDEQCDDANLVLWDGCNDCTIAEFVVNEWLSASQEDPAVALSNDGDMVVAWFDNSDRFGSSTRYVMARTYTADGSPPGSEWQASLIPGDEPEVEIDDSDRVIVVWHSPNTNMIVWYQCNYHGFFDIDGTALGDEFQICLGYDGIDHQATDVTAAADGSFIAAWTRSYESGFGHQYDALAQWFDPEGERVGEVEELAVAGHGTRRTRVASAADGRSVMVWHTFSQEAIHGNLYDADGTLVSWLFQVSSEPLFVLDGSLAVDMDDSGEFVVVWSQGSADSYEDRDILARSYAADGTPKGPPFVVNSIGGFRRKRVDVRIFPDGRRLVVWESLHQDGDGLGLYGRLLGPDDSFVGPEFRINTLTDGNQANPDIDMDPTGRFAIVWEDGDDVFAQRFDATAKPVGVLAW